MHFDKGMRFDIVGTMGLFVDIFKIEYSWLSRVSVSLSSTRNFGVEIAYNQNLSKMYMGLNTFSSYCFTFEDEINC